MATRCISPREKVSIPRAPSSMPTRSSRCALVDMADLTMSGAVLLEETLKFTGIAYLAAYLVTLAVSTLAEAIGRAA